MARFAARVLAASELLYDELLALAGSQNFGGNRRALHFRSADLQPVVVAAGQDACELDRLARACVAVVDLQHLAFFHSVLPSAVFDNRVHGWSC